MTTIKTETTKRIPYKVIQHAVLDALRQVDSSIPLTAEVTLWSDDRDGCGSWNMVADLNDTGPDNNDLELRVSYTNEEEL